MTTITPALLADIREKAEAVDAALAATKNPLSSNMFTRAKLEGLRGCLADRMGHLTTIALISALEEAQRERDAAVKAHNECAEWLKESEAARDAALAERDALRAENEKLRAALTAARTELFEAMDKFHVLGINHLGGQLCAKPGSMLAQHLDEDKAFMAKLADRMQAAAHAVDAALKETTHA